MNEMNTNNRDYDNRGYRESDYRNYRDYRDNREYDNRWDDEMEYGYREYDNRNNREYDNRRGYDRRGGKRNNRNNRSYRNYREEDYYEELEMVMEDMREQYRKIEDVSEMAENQQDKNMLMKIAQKEKENYGYIKQLVEK